MAIPPGRMRHDISEDRILLRTIQTAQTFGTLLANEMLKPNPAMAEPPLHADGYDWMYRQMDALGTRFQGTSLVSSFPRDISFQTTISTSS